MADNRPKLSAADYLTELNKLLRAVDCKFEPFFLSRSGTADWPCRGINPLVDQAYSAVASAVQARFAVTPPVKARATGKARQVRARR